jgi:hypothetical protein
VLNCTLRKEQGRRNQENRNNDKLEQIKRVLGLKESSDVKVFLVDEIVYGKKEKGLAEKEQNRNVEEEMEEVL